MKRLILFCAWILFSSSNPIAVDLPTAQTPLEQNTSTLYSVLRCPVCGTTSYNSARPCTLCGYQAGTGLGTEYNPPPTPVGGGLLLFVLLGLGYGGVRKLRVKS